MRLAPVLVVVGAAVLMVAWRRSLPGHFENPATDDMNSVRTIMWLLGDKLPIRDGAFDVYSLTAEMGEVRYDLFRSTRHGGPTDEEIIKGDYSTFPYARYHGDGKAVHNFPGDSSVSSEGVVPLLWDKQPDADNNRVVGFSSGSVRYVAEAEVQALLKKYGQLPQKPPPTPK